MMKQLRRWGGILAVLLTTHNLAAQQVLGRAVREVGGSPLLEALIVLLDDAGREQAREVRGWWARVASLGRDTSRVAYRVQELERAGLLPHGTAIDTPLGARTARQPTTG
jgi:hypothetical protein